MKRILVVDDNVDSADVLAMLLQLDGHEVDKVYSAAQALDAVTRWLPDVMLLDIGMPMMDGYAIARHLRADPAFAGLILVALTGYGRAEDRLRAREAGFDAHLVKPCDPKALEEILNACVAPCVTRATGG